MKEIKLFDYQEDMKERIEKALRLHRSVMAQMPTGTGKTVLLASVVESFLREHSNCNVWIVAHRRELVSQIKDTLNKFLLNFIFSNHPVPPSKEASKPSPDCLSAGASNVPVKAMSIQWLAKHYDEIKEGPGMIVIDEAHHALAKTYKEMW